MGMNIEKITLDEDTELAESMLSLTGHDVLALSKVFSLLHARSFGEDELDVLEEVQRKASDELDRALVESFGDDPAGRSKALIFMCSVCLDAMSTVYAHAESIAFKTSITHGIRSPLEMILKGLGGHGCTPPRATAAMARCER